MASNVVQTVVVGAGVVGLAVARALALRGHEVIVLEAGPMIGVGTSSRNSEVIHAGIYYAKGSLKAEACVKGRQLMYDFAKNYNVPFNNCGKLIVANSSEELRMLDGIIEKGKGNGVDDLRIISNDDAKALEPECQCLGAILSPSTGIIDSHSFMQALQGEAEDNGTFLVYNCTVEGGEVLEGDDAGLTKLIFKQDDPDGGEPSVESIYCKNLINTAGLYAPDLANSLVNFPAAAVPSPYFAKGNYFSLQGQSPFKRLIYPVPLKNTAGLGVHATIDMMGRTKFGPDVEWLEDFDFEKDYNVDETRAESFYAEIRRYYPNLKDNSLVADYSGIRPKISGPGMAAEDFRISAIEDHGVKGHVHLYGIESPGLTSSLALAEMISDIDLIGGGLYT